MAERCARLTVVLVTLFCSFLVNSDNNDDQFLFEAFPDNFLWGTATASYQVEGACKADGKGENIWDNFTHTGGLVLNNDTGDVACNSYYKYKDDVRLLKDLGAKHYRFSISWSRIFPTGKNDSYNAKGMEYYKNLTRELNANGIIPMATLYHWDLPQPLSDEGGWLNDAMVGYFENFADRCFKELGDSVKYWITINEPYVVCWLGYGIGIHAPGKKDRPDVDPYTCAHTIIKSHAKAWHLYDAKYRQSQNGKISITLNADWKEPKTNSTLDVEAAERAEQFMLGWFAHPIYKNGDYPKVMKDQIRMKSTNQGSTDSRLPEFTEDEKRMINGTHDFFGLNSYTTQLISHQIQATRSYEGDQDVAISYGDDWRRSASEWLYEVPWGIRKLLNWIKVEYDSPNVLITENGVSDSTGTLNDLSRIRFYSGYINDVLKAIKDGCNVIGYTAWSLLDNFEWHRGYSERFGLHYVDFKDSNRPRKAKASAKWFKELINDNGWPVHRGNGTVSPQMTTTVLFISMLFAFLM